MTKLPSNCELDRYGLHCRLVNEGDAEFIVKLRNTPELTRYFPRIDNDVEKQIGWIRSYKQREELGCDYYFMFEFKGDRVGVYRIAEINEDGTFMCGSLIFDSSLYKMASVAAMTMVHEIAFENLSLTKEVDFMGTHEDNKGLLMFKKRMGFIDTGERIDPLGRFITATLTKEDFYKNKDSITHFLLK